MRNVTDEFAKFIIEGSNFDRFGFKVKTVNEDTKEVVEEDEDTTVYCPLCESVLKEEISQDRLAEHVQQVLGMVEDILTESEDDDDEEEEEEEEEDES